MMVYFTLLPILGDDGFAWTYIKKHTHQKAHDAKDSDVCILFNYY